MTVTVVLSDCPPKLRGDMTKWFIEINTGVYVGNMSARVRDEVWARITENLGHGHATMIFTAAGEQRMDFLVHNAYWEPVDYDGIKLIRRPERTQTAEKTGFSTAAKRRMGAKKKSAEHSAVNWLSDYAIVDLEATGLDAKMDSIIEIGVLVVIQGTVRAEEQFLVRTDIPLPSEITRLTGITDQLLRSNGIPLDEALERLREIIEDLPILSHNAAFEHDFLCEACRKIGEDELENRFSDMLKLSKLLLPDLPDHKLSTLAAYLNVTPATAHRALEDCKTTYAIYRKLKELASSGMRKSENSRE